MGHGETALFCDRPMTTVGWNLGDGMRRALKGTRTDRPPSTRTGKTTGPTNGKINGYQYGRTFRSVQKLGKWLLATRYCCSWCLDGGVGDGGGFCIFCTL